MVVSMACMVMIGKQVYDPSVWLSRKLDMETSSFPHLCILQFQVQKRISVLVQDPQECMVTQQSARILCSYLSHGG